MKPLRIRRWPRHLAVFALSCLAATSHAATTYYWPELPLSATPPCGGSLQACIDGTAAGLHVVAWFDDLQQKREDALIQAARARGVGIYPVSALRVGPRRSKTVGLVMGYSALEIAQIERGCKLLAQAVAELD